jgi:hypothetical protein
VNPTSSERLVTFYKCGLCSKEYTHPERAAECCRCEKCDKRPVTQKKHQYMLGGVCEACCQAIGRAKTRKDIYRFDEELAGLERQRNEILSLRAKAVALYLVLGGKFRKDRPTDHDPKAVVLQEPAEEK